MKEQTNTLAFLGTLLIGLGFMSWLAISTMVGYIFAGIGAVLFLVGWLQESEK